VEVLEQEPASATIGNRFSKLSPSPGQNKRSQQKTLIVPKSDIVKNNSKRDSARQGHAPKVGEGLGVGIVRVSANRKKMSNLSSMVLKTRTDEEPEEEHVYPPYKDPTNQQDS